jgi:hypothetical protein
MRRSADLFTGCRVDSREDTRRGKSAHNSLRQTTTMRPTAEPSNQEVLAGLVERITWMLSDGAPREERPRSRRRRAGRAAGGDCGARSRALAVARDCTAFFAASRASSGSPRPSLTPRAFSAASQRAKVLRRERREPAGPPTNHGDCVPQCPC